MTVGLCQAACLIRVPTEVVKTRMQTSTYGNLAGSSLAAAKLVLSQEGIRGFYRGFGTTVMREVREIALRYDGLMAYVGCIDTLHITAVPSLRALEGTAVSSTRAEAVASLRGRRLWKHRWRFCGCPHNTTGCPQNEGHARHQSEH